MTEKIDVVVPWVNGSDPEWLGEKRKYEGGSKNTDNHEARFRDWNLMRYFFRGIEKNMPWVNKVYFITWGHVPEWLNTECDKLQIVNHKDYIPEEYLPTFNSHTIELNIHRIKGLSEHFIYFNDDVFAIDMLKPEWFFLKGKPRDMLVAGTLVNEEPDSCIWHVVLNDMGIINKYFHGGKHSLPNLWKWVNARYGAEFCVKNAFKILNRAFSVFWCPHITNAFNKSTFEKLWQLEGGYLDKVCRNKFRTPYDLNQWLMKYWQLASGEFEPIDIRKIGQYVGITGQDRSLDVACDIVKNRKKHIVCINDTLYGNISYEGFAKCRDRVINAFDEILSDKSSFEK